MKKGFTLIELLAVIIILAIVALIATPIILDVIDEAQESANLSQAYLLLDGAEQLYANSFLNNGAGLEFSDTKENNVYGSLATTGEKPPTGDLFIKSNGDIKMEVIIDGTCYKKDYNDQEITKCDSTGDGNNSGDNGNSSNYKPSIASIINLDIFDATRWYNSSENIEIKNYNYDYKYCLSDSFCEPDLTESSPISAAGNHGKYLCVDLYSDNRVIATDCGAILVDDFTPVITVSDNLSIMEGQSKHVSTFYTATFGKSRGAVSCNIEETSILIKGDNKITCIARSESNLETTVDFNINVTDLVPTPENCFVKSSTTLVKYSCQSTDIVIPDTLGITSISFQYLPSDSFKFTSVVIPEGVTTINSEAFYQHSLSSIILPDSITTISSLAFQGNDLKYVKFGTGLKTISNSAFTSNKLTSIILPDSVTTIGTSAFGNNELSAVKFPDNVEFTIIRQATFAQNKLKAINIPSSVTEIEKGAFTNNEISTLGIHNNVTIIGFDAFGDNKVKELTLGSRFSALPPGIDINTIEVMILTGRTESNNPFSSNTDIDFVFPN